MRTDAATQRSLDRTAYDMFVDCHLDAREAARQMGISPRLVRARVRRESLRLAAAEHQERTNPMRIHSDPTTTEMVAAGIVAGDPEPAVRYDDYYGRATVTGRLPSGRAVDVEVYGPTTRFGQPHEAQVNWSALGSTSPEDAAAYGLLLIKAAVVAKTFYDGFGDRHGIDSDTDACRCGAEIQYFEDPDRHGHVGMGCEDGGVWIDRGMPVCRTHGRRTCHRCEDGGQS